jgi:hypothetical protein
MTTEKQLFESIQTDTPKPDKNRGLDIGIWNDPEIWLTLMRKMRDADTSLYYSSGAQGTIRLAFTNEYFSEYLATVPFMGMIMPALRPIEGTIPKDGVTVNGITFSKWEVLAIMRAANPNVWYAITD